jgi:hypothetical protein
MLTTSARTRKRAPVVDAISRVEGAAASGQGPLSARVIAPDAESRPGAPIVIGFDAIPCRPKPAQVRRALKALLDLSAGYHLSRKQELEAIVAGGRPPSQRRATLSSARPAGMTIICARG